MDKAKRKEILKKYKEEQEQKFLNSLPMPVEKFVQLFDYLDKANQGCKGDLQLTVRFLEEHQCPVMCIRDRLKMWWSGFIKTVVAAIVKC